MKKKIAVWCALFALLVGFVPPGSARADDTAEEWTNFGEYWLSQGYAMEDLPFEYDANKRYLYARNSASRYYILVFDESADFSDVYYYDGYIYPCSTYEFAYRGEIGAWEGLTVSSFKLYNTLLSSVLYTDFCIPNKGGDECYIHKTQTGEGVSFDYALADMGDSLKETLQSYSYYVVAKVPYRVNDYMSEQIMIAVSNSGKVIIRDEAYMQIWFTTGSGKEAGATYSYHSNCCFWSEKSGSNGYIIGDTEVSGGPAPEILWTNCDIYYEDGTSYALTNDVWFEAYPYSADDVEEEEVQEVITDGFPRLFEVSASYAIVYEGIAASSLKVIALTNGRGGIVYGLEYDSDGVAWYEVSVYYNGTAYDGYIKADAVDVGATVPVTGGGSETTTTPTPTVAPSGGGGSIDWSDFNITDIPEILKKVKDTIVSVLDLVGVVPLMIGAVFGFLPDWCLLMIGVSVVVVCLVGIVKALKG